MNTESIEEEIKCLTTMILREDKKHADAVNPLHCRQIYLISKLVDYDEKQERIF